MKYYMFVYPAGIVPYYLSRQLQMRNFTV